MIDYDLSCRPGRPSEWQALAAAVIASTDPEENYWLESKSRLDWSKPHGVGTLGKAVLALANRDPLRASAALEGRGVVIVSEVAPLDNAVLEDKLSVYVGGSDGPRWHPHWVDVDGHPVLVVEVDTPQHGDPPYSLRQKFGDYRASQVFVREIGKTVLASQADTERLARRLLGKDAKETLDIVVGAHVSEPLSTYYWDAAALESFLGKERAKLLVPLQEAQAAAAAAAAEAEKPIVLTGLRGVSGSNTMSELLGNITNPYPNLLNELVAEREVPEPRTADQYVAEVEKYIEAVRSAMPKALEAVAANVVIAPLFFLTNLSDRNFRDVEVTIRVDGQASASDVDDRPSVNPAAENLHSMLPKPPRPYGPYKRPTGLGLVGRMPWAGHSQLAAASVASWNPGALGRRDIRNGHGFEADFEAVDLRPRKRDLAIESELALVVPRDRTDPVIVQWHATASNVNAVASGEFVIPFEGRPIDALATALRR